MSEMLLPLFKLLVGIAIPLAAFVGGLRATDPLWLWKRRSLLGRSLLSILLVVPVVTVLLLEWLVPDNVYLRAGIVVSILSVGIAPPHLMKGARSRDEAACFEIGLDVVLLTLATIYIPVAVAIHGAVFGHHVALSAGAVARVVFAKALVPFLAGLTLMRVWPKLGPRVERPAERFVNVTLLIVVVFALAVAFRALAGVGARGWLTCAAIAMVALVIGHLLGGPAPATRSVLAVSSAVRFPALALLITSVVPGGRGLIPFVLAYVISSGVLSGVYGAAVARRQAALRAEAKS